MANVFGRKLYLLLLFITIIPLLFILHINNIDHNVSDVKSNFYADDTVLYCSAPTAEWALPQLQLAFNTFQQNLYLLKLVLNADKT